MHARYRSGPGNGYRSNPMGMAGIAAASRVSPEGSMRGPRMYNADYRNNNRGGFGRGGHSKKFQPPAASPREDDIFMVAGKLATEYLVSKGILPPNALTGKWQNGRIRNQMGDFQGFKPREGDNMQSPMDGRQPAQSHSGNAASDVGSDRRRFSDEFNSPGLRNYTRDRRRNGSFKSYGSEWNRDFARSGSSSDMGRASPGLEADTDTSTGNPGGQPAGKNGETSSLKSSPAKSAQASERTTGLESGLEKCNSADVESRVVSSSSNEKDIVLNADVDLIKESGDAKIFKAEAGEKNGNNNNEISLNHSEDMKVMGSTQDDILASQGSSGLTKHCGFEEIPTKTQSSSTVVTPETDPNTMSHDKNISEHKPSEGIVDSVMDMPIDVSLSDTSAQPSDGLKTLDSEILKAPLVEEELNIAYTSSGHCPRSNSFQERSVYKEELDDMVSGFGRSNSMFMERGAKRTINYENDREVTKKPREWTPPEEIRADGCLPLSKSTENLLTSQVPSDSGIEQIPLSASSKSLDISLLRTDQVEQCQYTEEKQLFPGSSFKTCDLNLIETCDVNENHSADPMILFPSMKETSKQGTPVDIDLSITDNGGLPNKYGKCGEIEVIDLESDSVQEENVSNNQERRVDSRFSALDGFPNNVHNANEIPEVQDGYGLMLSELLGNDSPNCSPVPTDLNSLQNDMGLHNGEGILGDDDPIYMSLGEIPISFLRPWEQPTQDYGKPF